MKFTVGQEVWIAWMRHRGARYETVKKVGRKWVEVGPNHARFDMATGEAEADSSQIYMSKEDHDERIRRFKVFTAFRESVGYRWAFRDTVVSSERLIEIAAELGIKIDVPKGEA